MKKKKKLSKLPKYWVAFMLYNTFTMTCCVCYIKSYHFSQRSHFISLGIMNESVDIIILLLHISIRVCKFKNSWKFIFGKSSRFISFYLIKIFCTFKQIFLFSGWWLHLLLKEFNSVSSVERTTCEILIFYVINVNSTYAL